VSESETPERATPAGEATRQKAIDALCEAFAEDRIPVDEFERRVELAHRAETTQELRQLLSGLPGAPVPARASRAPTSEGDEDEAGRALAEIDGRAQGAYLMRRPTQAPGQVRPTSFIGGIMGGGSRQGAWYPARVNYALGFMGGFSLDLREAPLPPGVTEIKLFCFWGGGEIIVPPDVTVEVSILGIMGGFNYDHAVPGTLDPDAPVVHITGVCLMGGAEISVRYAGETPRDAKRRRREEKKKRKLALRRRTTEGD
jgi:hypothetical protein